MQQRMRRCDHLCHHSNNQSRQVTLNICAFRGYHCCQPPQYYWKLIANTLVEVFLKVWRPVMAASEHCQCCSVKRDNNHYCQP